MQVYLVGGAVRDAMLGMPVKERDWVVVGGTRASSCCGSAIARSGRDFPVFLHPDTHEEYALARRERKIAPGYRGFSVEFGPEVTLEEDLARRDLTINAMARSADGALIDPYGGKRDIESRTLAARVGGFHRGSGARAARGALRGALRAARLSRGRRHIVA